MLPFQAHEDRSLGHSAQRRNAFGRAERSVPQRIAQLVARVAVGMATVAAHPVVMRETGVEKEAFAAVSSRQGGLRPERDADRLADDRMVVVPLDDGDRVAERVGHIESGTVVARRERGGPNSDGQSVKVGVVPGKWPWCQTAGSDFPHAGERHVDCPVLRHGDRRRVGRAVAHIAELKELAVGEDVFVRVLNRIAVERPQHAFETIDPQWASAASV